MASTATSNLSVNPVTGRAVLRVPRRMRRLLPWINYGDFYGSEAQLLLPPKPKLPRYPGTAPAKRLEVAKAEMVVKLRGNTRILDQYVGRKEREGAAAVPLLADPMDQATLRITGEGLLTRLAAIPTGAQASGDYQRVVYEILNFLFEPDLTGGQMKCSRIEPGHRAPGHHLLERGRGVVLAIRSRHLPEPSPHVRVQEHGCP